MTARDGLDEAETSLLAKPTLDYPLGAPPEAAGVREIAPGIQWVRMPLPFALEWINLWLLEDGAGWTVVDTGVGNDATRAHWERIFAAHLNGKPVTRVISTHMHGDHLGLSGWMTKKFGATFWISRLEYTTCRALASDTGRSAPEDGIRFYRAAGWNEEELEMYRARFGGFGAQMSLPDSFIRLSDGDVLDIGRYKWRVVMGNGHSPEHACLYCEELGFFISGDQLLPRITSNVSVYPTEPNADPLRDWLNSCARIKNIVASDVLVLPAHNEPFVGAHKRLQYLIDSHERGLERIEKRLRQAPRRAVDLFGALFARKITPDVLSMATGESLAHLNCLIGRGRVKRVLDEAGVAFYEPN